MKIIIALVTTLVLMLPFTACNGTADSDTSSQTQSGASELSSSSDLPAYDYTYNKYALPPAVKESLGASDEAYRAAVDAIEARAESFNVSDEAAFEVVRKALGGYYPPAGLVTEMRYDSATKDVHLTYRYNANVHKQQLEKAGQVTEKIIDLALREGDSEAIKALALYRYVASGVHNNGKADSTLWSALLDGVAGNRPIAEMYAFLLAQAGVESVAVTAKDADGGDHAMVAVRIDGAWSLMDPTYELDRSGGSGLACFGMTEKDIAGNRLSLPLTAAFGQAPACSDTRFAGLRLCARWSFDTERTKLKLTIDGKSQLFDLLENNQ